MADFSSFALSAGPGIIEGVRFASLYPVGQMSGYDQAIVTETM